MKTLKELMDLRGRVAVVTGGGGHLGAVLGEALAELGARIVLVDLRADACEAAARRICVATGVDTHPLPADLACEEEVCAVPPAVLDRFGRLDILVNCAALAGTSDLQGWAVAFEKQSPATWRCALEVNLTAPFILAQAAAGALRASGHGTVINISSIYGQVGPDLGLYAGTAMGNPAAYGASKGGLLQLTRWLATVLAPDIRVNALSPGGIARGQPAAFQERYRARTPLKRMGAEEDFKGAVAYLASDLSAYVTGQNLIVDGGWTAW